MNHLYFCRYSAAAASKETQRSCWPASSPVDLLAVKADLKRRADELGKRLPKNPLDMLIDKLGPENVAEVIKTLKGMAAHEKYFNMSCFWLS